jgi:hypothetical protein
MRRICGWPDHLVPGAGQDLRHPQRNLLTSSRYHDSHTASLFGAARGLLRDQVCGSFGDGQDGRVGVGADHRRHHGGVGDA